VNAPQCYVYTYIACNVLVLKRLYVSSGPYRNRPRVDRTSQKHQLLHLTGFDLQLDALNSCLFTYNTFIKTPLHVSSINPAHHQEVYVVIVYVQPLVSSLSTGDCIAQDSHLQRVTIPEAARIQLRRGPPDDEQG
jgi:hypothetical protein